jgi:hypothetical protein
MALTAESTVQRPMPIGPWVMAPAISPFLMASICAWPESKPTMVSAPGSSPSSLAAFTMPIAEPSLVP